MTSEIGADQPSDGNCVCVPSFFRISSKCFLKAEQLSRNMLINRGIHAYVHINTDKHAHIQT